MRGALESVVCSIYQASVLGKPVEAIDPAVRLFVCWYWSGAATCTNRREEAHPPPLPLVLPAEMDANMDLVTSEDGSLHSMQQNNMLWQQPPAEQQQQQQQKQQQQQQQLPPPPPQQQYCPEYALQNWQHQASQPFQYGASPTRQQGPPCGGNVARGGARKLSTYRSRSTGATRMLSTAAAEAVTAHQVRQHTTCC